MNLNDSGRAEVDSHRLRPASPVLLIGAGRTGRAVLAGIDANAAVTVIDLDPMALVDLPGRPTRTMVGDGTSRLVLQDAGAGPRTRVVATTGSDRVNREILRLAQELGCEERICVLDDPGDTISEAVSRPFACASQVLNRISVGSNRGSALGLGQGELVQVTVLQGSQAIGRDLRELGASHWLVAALYREERLVVPHGSTRITVGDRVLLVGEPEVLEDVAAFIRGGAPVFPYQYGPDVLHDEDADSVAWASWLVQVSEARGMRPMVGDDPAAGCLVRRPVSVGWLARAGLAVSLVHEELASARCPTLIARGAPMVRKILLAAGELTPEVALVAFDLARQTGAALTALHVRPPELVRGDPLAPGRDPKDLHRLAHLHGVTLEYREASGNPVVQVCQQAREHDLLVIGASVRRPSMFDPDVSLHLLHGVTCALLVVPRRGR